MPGWQDPLLDAEHIAWARDGGASDGAVVVRRRVCELHAGGRSHRPRPGAFGDEAFVRLQALKGRLDPDNVLRRNQNIPPRAV